MQSQHHHNALRAMTATVTICSQWTIKKRAVLKTARLCDGRSTRIRTLDPLVPNQVRYRAALHSENKDDTF